MKTNDPLKDGISRLELVETMPKLEVHHYDDGNSISTLDLEVPKVARVSIGGQDGVKGYFSDVKLLKYLWENKHMTPFEHVVFKFYVKAPIFVVRQWMRHRTQSYNEMSQRYTVVPYEFYIPDKIRLQSKKKKQGSDGFLVEEKNEELKDQIRNTYQKSYLAYNKLIENGVAKEVARMVLPSSVYTEFITTVNLRNLLAFLKLRNANDAQWEIRQYAKEIERLLKVTVPEVMKVKDNE